MISNKKRITRLDNLKIQLWNYANHIVIGCLQDWNLRNTLWWRDDVPFGGIRDIKLTFLDKKNLTFCLLQVWLKSKRMPRPKGSTKESLQKRKNEDDWKPKGKISAYAFFVQVKLSCMERNFVSTYGWRLCRIGFCLAKIKNLFLHVFNNQFQNPDFDEDWHFLTVIKFWAKLVSH
jgi:hypothetical protein